LTNELAIKIDYLDERLNPSEIFEAMAIYVNAYRDLGQLLTNSIGVNVDFEFKLSGIEKGSIISRLTTMSSKVEGVFETSIFNSAHTLFENLTEISETETEDDVEKLAVIVESSLAEHDTGSLLDPHIDRKNLATVLNKFSDAHKKLKTEESVVFTSSGIDLNNECNVNVTWRFTGELSSMFIGETISHKIPDKVYVQVGVNEGLKAWTFKSITLKESFTARIICKDWLERYQSGLIQAIGPKDVLEVELSYDVYTPPDGKGKPMIRNAKVIKVNDIQRNNEYQHEIKNF
jgi:hypothetical protein